MSRTYTTYTATSSLPVLYSYTCQHCGGLVNAEGAFTASSSTTASGSSRRFVNTDSLKTSASESLLNEIQKTNERTAALHQAIVEPDLKAKYKQIRKNRLDGPLNNKCPHCKKRQGWGGSLFGAGWVTLLVFLYYCIAAAVFGIIVPLTSYSPRPVQWNTVIPSGVISLIGVIVLTAWRRKVRHRIYDGMTDECIPTVSVRINRTEPDPDPVAEQIRAMREHFGR